MAEIKNTVLLKDVVEFRNSGMKWKDIAHETSYSQTTCKRYYGLSKTAKEFEVTLKDRSTSLLVDTITVTGGFIEGCCILMKRSTTLKALDLPHWDFINQDGEVVNITQVWKLLKK